MSSPLLINAPPLQVLPSLAVVVGLNEAIVLQQIHYWMQRADTCINGHVWVYNSVAQWKQQFPFWSDDTIARALKSLRKSGVLVAEQLSKDPRDRSLFYRIDYRKVQAPMRECITASCGNGRPQDAAIPKKTETTTEIRGDASKLATPPKARKKSKALSLTDWLAQVAAAGKKAIPDDDAVRSYAAKAGIPDDFLLLAWVEFKARYSEPDAKTYTDWRQVFRNAVRGNWLKLWFVNQDGYQLTTTGKQAQQLLEHAE